MKKLLGLGLSVLLLLALGLAGGYYAAVQNQELAADAHAEDAAVTALSPQTLANLGVKVEAASLRRHVHHVEVQATVEEAPGNQWLLVAPLAGEVRQLNKLPGEWGKPGDAVVTLLRDAIAQPELKLTGDFIKPVNEDLHRSFSELRSAAASADIFAKELKRLQGLNKTADGSGLRVVSKQRIVDTRYDLQKAQQNLQAVRIELEHHGLQGKEIDDLQKGGHPPVNMVLWQRQLEVHGLWGAAVKKIHKSLSAQQREQNWNIALLGELSAQGLVTEALQQAMAESLELRRDFPVAVALLLAGHSLDQVSHWAEQGYLLPTVVLRIPQVGQVEDWDVGRLDVVKGQRVEAGAVLAQLHNPRRMWLRARPVGQELAYMTGALKDKLVVRARPLLSGSGPLLQDLSVQQVTGEGAWLACENTPLAQGEESLQRSWQLRSGLQYVLQVPLQTIEQGYVLPREAVVELGPDQVVFMEDGDSFRAIPVEVIFTDHSMVVLRNVGIYPGDRLVTHGAFALSLALQSNQKEDPHAGHSH